ncbi:MAG: hypothetical protein U0414_18565 [Polyangiaceae bacterium]
MAWTLDRAHSDVSIETTAKGMFAKLAHDLRLLAGELTATVTEGEGGRLGVELHLPVRAIKVDGVRKSGQVDRSVLSASDRSDIEKKIREDVLRSSEVKVTVPLPGVPSPGSTTADATVEVGGYRSSVPLRLTIATKDGRTHAAGRAKVSLSALKIPPVKGPLNAFRVDDDVEIVFDVAFSAA